MHIYKNYMIISATLFSQINQHHTSVHFLVHFSHNKTFQLKWRNTCSFFWKTNIFTSNNLKAIMFSEHKLFPNIQINTNLLIGSQKFLGRREYKKRDGKTLHITGLIIGKIFENLRIKVWKVYNNELSFSKIVQSIILLMKPTSS